MAVLTFIAEMGDPRHRPRLVTSVKTGYLTVFGFFVLSVLADRLGVLPFRYAFFVPMFVKLATNTAALVALGLDRGVLWTATVNVATDMFTMTAVIYFTGGELSPLFPIYLIEITVVALLGNVGLTVLCSVGAIVMYSLMAVFVRTGVLPLTVPPVARTGGLTGTYVAVDLAYAAFVLAVPTYYAARILQSLRHDRDALQRRNRQLVETGKQRSQFMANVTHELRTPVQGICGLSDHLEAGSYGPITPKQRDAQQSIKRSARSLLALVDDLLELARTDAAKLETRPEPVDMGELVSTVVSAARGMVGTKKLAVEAEVEAGLPSVETDPRSIKQVLLNFLSNAAKFTDEGGRIAVRARRDGPWAVRLEVSDTGIGIVPHDQARLFEEFRQLDGSAERQYGGVGLAMVARLTESVGARVELQSETGRGSTFAVVVPTVWKPGAGAKAA